MKVSWAERMAKPCVKCKTVNPPEDGYVDVDDVFILGYICGWCGHNYSAKIQLNDVKVELLTGMSQKGQANKGGRG